MKYLHFRASYVAPLSQLALSCAVLLLVFFQLRTFREAPGHPTLEVPYHVLLTTKALAGSPISEHWLLPSVSLSLPGDKSIPWGATQPTSAGHQIYTSFTPPGFLAPFLWFSATGIEYNPFNLALFGLFLGCVANAVLYFLLVELLTPLAGRERAHLGAFAGAMIGLFSREALLSLGFLYWAHSLYHLLSVLTLYSLLKFLRSADVRWKLSFIVLTFLGPTVEWTGFIFNAGVFLFFANKGKSCRDMAAGVAVSTMLAFAYIFLHFGLAIGFVTTLQNFIYRFQGRSGAVGNVHEMLAGYVVSYGLFIPFVFCCLGYLAFRAVDSREQSGDLIGPILLVSSIPLVENLLLVQHATQFSFDRLKFCIPAAIAIAAAVAHSGKTMRAVSKRRANDTL